MELWEEFMDLFVFDAASSLDYIASNDRMNIELEAYGRRR